MILITETNLTHLATARQCDAENYFCHYNTNREDRDTKYYPEDEYQFV